MTDLSLINAALTRTGNDPITSLSDGTTESVVAAQNYAEIVGQMLGDYPWRFCTTQQALNLLVERPPEPYLYSFQLPNDVLLLRDLRQCGEPIEYQQVGQTVQTRTKPSDADPVGTAIVATVTFLKPEASWPHYFRKIVVIKLEALFLRAIGERYAEADARDAKVDPVSGSEWRTACNRDAQQARVINPWHTPILGVHGGRPPRSWRQ